MAPLYTNPNSSPLLLPLSLSLYLSLSPKLIYIYTQNNKKKTLQSTSTNHQINKKPKISSNYNENKFIPVVVLGQTKILSTVMIGVLPYYNNDEVAHGCVRRKIHVYDVIGVVGGWPQRQGNLLETVRWLCQVWWSAKRERERERERERLQKKFKNQEENVLIK